MGAGWWVTTKPQRGYTTCAWHTGCAGGRASISAWGCCWGGRLLCFWTKPSFVTDGEYCNVVQRLLVSAWVVVGRCFCCICVCNPSINNLPRPPCTTTISSPHTPRASTATAMCPMRGDGASCFDDDVHLIILCFWVLVTWVYMGWNPKIINHQKIMKKSWERKGIMAPHRCAVMVS